MVVGSTGSGKTACMLLPSILSQKTGSAQIIDIKSHELSIRSSDIYDPKTMIIDLDHKAFYTWGWDIFYKLPKEGEVQEGDVLEVIQEVASVVVPKPTSGDAFWSDAARNEFSGLMLYEFCYGESREFIDIIHTMMNVPLREHLELALNTVQKHSLVVSYLTSLAAAADETLFSVDLTLSQCIFPFVSNDAVWFLRDNPRRANPTMLNEEGVRQYLCVS
jgi:type IV secretory pathway TraG/TraD family ATPase VirD4